jgi:hypothetical protein
VDPYRFTADLWQAPGGSWHFVTVPIDVTDEIDETAPSARVAFRSARVDVTIGRTNWQTSVFPDRRVGAFVLPLKRTVREVEGLAAGDAVDITLWVLPVPNERPRTGEASAASFIDRQARGMRRTVTTT